MKDNVQDSFYVFMGDDYEAPTSGPVLVNTPPPVYEESKTPFANRKDLNQPYASTFNQKAASVPTDSKPLTSGAYEWSKFIANRSSNNHIAMKVNAMFKRNDINGDNFLEIKAKYLQNYKLESEK